MNHVIAKAKAELEGESPHARVVAVFGSKRTAQLVDLTTEAVRKWGERGGRIPSRYQKTLLEAAEAEGLPLTAADFIA